MSVYFDVELFANCRKPPYQSQNNLLPVKLFYECCWNSIIMEPNPCWRLDLIKASYQTKLLFSKQLEMIFSLKDITTKHLSYMYWQFIGVIPRCKVNSTSNEVSFQNRYCIHPSVCLYSSVNPSHLSVNKNFSYI